MDTPSATNNQQRLNEIETLIEVNEHHILNAFKRQCRRYASAANVRNGPPQRSTSRPPC